MDDVAGFILEGKSLRWVAYIDILPFGRFIPFRIYTSHQPAIHPRLELPPKHLQRTKLSSKNLKMARTRQTTTKPSLLSRLAGKKSTTTTTKQSHNPLTGKTKTTSTTTGGTTTHGPHATHGTHATHGHTHSHGTRGSTANPVTGAHHTQRRKVSMGDKVSGAMMKLNGTLTRRPGKKVCH
jgi:hypothetical protein